MRRFFLKLSFLVVPFVVLSLVLLDDGGSGGIGGGGYDLSGLVYGLCLFAVVIIWMLWMLIAYLRSGKTERKFLLWLLVIGVVALVGAWFITPRMF